MIAGLPYDAEVEWIQPSGGAYINTGITVSLDKFDWMVDIAFGSSIVITQHQFMFGAVYQGDMCGVTQGMYLVLRPGWHISSPVRDICSDGERVKIRVVKSAGSSSLFLNGSQVVTSTESPSYSSGVFCVLGSDLGQYPSAFSPYLLYGASDAGGAFNLIPVRFTNSNGQSEGAMYDRVSRKLFRNAGTGAFTIGPDVATPVMGLHFFKSQIKTAKDYVQNGLIAMWDGIENAGWGVHNPNATSWVDLTGRGADMLLKDANTTEMFEVGSDYVKILNGIGWNGRGHCTPSWASGDDVVTVEIVLDNGDFDTSGSAVARVANFGVGNGNTFPAVCLVGTKFTHVKYNQYPKFDIGVGCSSISLVYNEQKVFLNGVSILSDKVTDGGYTYFAPCISAYSATAAIGTKIKSMRIYSRVLTDAERLANYAVDKRRFNLP